MERQRSVYLILLPVFYFACGGPAGILEVVLIWQLAPAR